MLVQVHLMMSAESQAYAPIAGFYDLMVADRTPHTRFYSNLLEAGPKSVIDIGCGTGTVTSALAEKLREQTPQRMVRVAGLDGSAEMLEVAQMRDPTVEWILGDLRDVPDCGPFELAVSCYNTLQHVDAQGLARAFRSIRAVLASRGRLAFDIYKPNIDYISVKRTDSLARSLAGPNGEALEIREDSEFDESTGALYLNWRLIDTKNPRAPALVETRYCMWQHGPEDVEGALSSAGFKIIERFGNLDRSPFNAQSKKQVTVCEAI